MQTCKRLRTIGCACGLFPLSAAAHPGHGPDAMLTGAAAHDGWILAGALLVIAVAALAACRRAVRGA